MQKIFFFDIDGTLAIHGVIPESNLKALQLLKERGYYTFICTGRSPFYAQNLFANLVDGLITCNGRYILYHHQKLHGEAFSKEELYDYQEKIKKLEAGAMFVSDNVAVPYLLDEKQIQEIQKEYGKQHIQLLPKELSFYTFDLFYDSLSKRDELIEAFRKELVINDHGGHGSCDCSTIGFDKFANKPSKSLSKIHSYRSGHVDGAALRFPFRIFRAQSRCLIFLPYVFSVNFAFT